MLSAEGATSQPLAFPQRYTSSSFSWKRPSAFSFSYTCNNCTAMIEPDSHTIHTGSAHEDARGSEHQNASCDRESPQAGMHEQACMMPVMSSSKQEFERKRCRAMQAPTMVSWISSSCMHLFQAPTRAAGFADHDGQALGSKAECDISPIPGRAAGLCGRPRWSRGCPSGCWRPAGSWPGSAG